MASPTVYDLPPEPGYHPEIGLLVSSLKHATRAWRGEMGRVSKEAIVWQPFEGGHSIGGALLHIADVEGWWIEDFSMKRNRPPEELQRLMSEQIRQYKVQWPTPPKKPLSWYYALLDEVRERTLATLKEFDPPDLAVPWRGAYAFTLRWVLNHVIEHENYHAGQAVLLKLMWQRRLRE